jgi:hypothetical protein
MAYDRQRIDRLIEQLDLQAHPEGGRYRQTYRSSEHVVRPLTGHAHAERREVSPWPAARWLRALNSIPSSSPAFPHWLSFILSIRPC